MLSHPRGKCLLTEAGPCRSWLAGVGVGTWILGFRQSYLPTSFLLQRTPHLRTCYPFLHYKMAFRNFL